MTTLPGCDEYRGIYYYRSQDEAEAFYYLPATPGPERDQQGRPTLLLLASDQGAILQLGARWEAEAGALEELRDRLAQQFQIAPALIRLSPAPLTIDRVTLSVGDGQGVLTQLQSTSSSGYAPFSAIFNATLTAGQKSQALAALGGREGLLVVTYHGSATLPDSTVAAQWCPPVTARPLERSTDVGAWFAKGGGLEHVQMVGVPIGGQPQPQPEPKAMKVRLGFDAKGAPVVYVQATCGKAVETLRSPAFSPVTLSAVEAGQPLIVKTAYTTGGPPYETKLTSPGPEGWVLTPGDLGIALVTLDATARRKAGAKAAQVRVHYRPSGAGAEDEQLINFRYGDWTESWFVVTRSPGLGGHLEVELKETTADGSVVKHPPFTADDPVLSL